MKKTAHWAETDYTASALDSMVFSPKDNEKVYNRFFSFKRLTCIKRLL